MTLKSPKQYIISIYPVLEALIEQIIPLLLVRVILDQ